MREETFFTIGHGVGTVEELVETLQEAGVRTLVDVRRFPGSRRNPQFNEAALRGSVEAAGIAYRHAVELGGRRANEPGEERFSCIRTAAFRSYAARMGSEAWQRALGEEVAQPVPCFMCAETVWWRCHRRFIAELLTARGARVVHLLGPGRADAHRLMPGAEISEGRLYICGSLVA